jgi:pyrimidine operon attenuation protein/uracil phosphoribosyltransferase
MPIEVTEFEEKKYIIADAEFKLKKPTLGIKRRGYLLSTILSVKVQELESAVDKLRDVDNIINQNDISALQKLSESAEQTMEIYNEIYVKGEELLKLVLEPVKAGDEIKLTADNIDEFIIRDVSTDFFTLAGPLTVPANS